MDRALLNRVDQQAWFHRFPRGFPFLLFALVSLGTIFAVLAIERSDEQRRKLELDRNLTEITSGIQRRATENAVLLRAAAALFETQPKVTSAEVEEFAAGLQHGEQSHSALGFGWAPLVPVGKLARFELARQEAPGGEGFTVFPRPGPDTVVVVPILHLVPRAGANRKAIGFDMYSDPERRTAIDRSIELDAPVASGKVEIVSTRTDDPSNVGFIFVMPVHAAPSSKLIKGFVYSPFRARDFVASAAELHSNREVDIELYDGEPVPENLLADRSVLGVGGLTMERRIVIGYREWTLRVQDKRPTALTPLSRLTVFFGAVASLLVMAIGWLITKRAVEDREVLELLTRQAAIRDSLTRELNHRVKNTLANVLSIAALTRRRSSDLDDFSESFTGRIQALSATHDLLSETDWRDADLREIVKSELAPYLQGDAVQAHISGPDIALAPNDAMSLGLAIHELATNAAKYGALSSPDGSIHVDWNLSGPDQAEVRWREEGGPTVSQPDRRGFGRDLIEKIVAHELGSAVDLTFDPGGVRCTLHVQVRRSSEFRLRNARG